MARKSSIGDNVTMTVFVWGFLITIFSGFCSGSIIECPSCGMVDYSGLTGTEDCLVKQGVAAAFGDAFGVSINGSSCSFLEVPLASCLNAEYSHCFYMKTCGKIADDDDSYGGVTGTVCIHTQQCLGPFLASTPAAQGMSDGMVCPMLDDSQGCSMFVDSTWRESGMTADGCITECCLADTGDCLTLAVSEITGKICMNVTFQDSLADSMSSAYNELAAPLHGALFSYASCSVKNFAGLEILGAMQDEICSHGSVFTFKIGEHMGSDWTKCDVQSALLPYKDMLGSESNPVHSILIDGCDESESDEQGGMSSSPEISNPHALILGTTMVQFIRML